ncbi:hypothetical protein GOBAR_DD00949 [Gossypium barbadense]|nr:hypothetical protein GOBAR_DD00949 [Gossypium barbadense]
MELVYNEDVQTIIALYCGNRSDQNALIHLFPELAYGEEHGAQEPCMVAPISYIVSESIIRWIDIDLNVAANIDVVGDDGYDSSDPCDQEVDSDSDSNVDEVPDDIDYEDVNDNGNINAFSLENQIRRIVIYNNPEPHMLLINPEATHVTEFLEYPKILPAHRLAKYIHDVLKRFELRRPSVVDSVYHLGPIELISETDGAIVGGSKHFIVHRSTSSLVAGRGVRNMEEKSYALNAVDELEPEGVSYYGGYDPGGVKYYSGYGPRGVLYCGGYDLKISNPE